MPSRATVCWVTTNLTAAVGFAWKRADNSLIATFTFPGQVRNLSGIVGSIGELAGSYLQPLGANGSVTFRTHWIRLEPGHTGG